MITLNYVGDGSEKGLEGWTHTCDCRVVGPGLDSDLSVFSPLAAAAAWEAWSLCSASSSITER